MGLASKPAQQGDASSAAPSQPFNEAAAYARQQAEANATNGTSTGAPNSGTPAATGAAASAPPAAAAADNSPALAGPTPPLHGQHPPQQVPPSGHQPQTAPPSGGQWANPGNPSQPVQGVPVRGPAQQPQPQHVIIGYMLVTPQDSCSCDLRLEGWLVVLVLLLTFPCIAWIPCMIPDCFQPYQVPIYGPPGSYPVPIATPYYA